MKVLITTSGTGSRLGKLTAKVNKALVSINRRPAISYLIDSYPLETEFVITLGYLGLQVREALLRLFPRRKFHFITVSPYQGEGSSLGYSMLASKKLLNEPFIFHACDTIINQPVPPPDNNWAAGYQLTGDASQYRTLEVSGGQVLAVNDKGIGNSDYAHIGLVGVADYRAFWKHLGDLYQENPNNQALNDTDVINRLLERGHQFEFRLVDRWYDTGNPVALARTVKTLKDSDNV